MLCPNCLVKLEEFGYISECPRCHFVSYFNGTKKSFNTELDMDTEF